MQTKNDAIEPASPIKLLPIHTCLALGVFMISMAGLLSVQYGMSGHYSVDVAVSNSSGSSQWRDFWHVPARTIEDSQLAAIMRVCLICAWIAYGVVLTFLRSAPISKKALVRVSIAVAIVTALFFPPSLSADSYLYAGYGRMLVTYHQNPYVTSTDLLAANHDPIATILSPDSNGPVRHMFWTSPSVYGPVWTLVEAASALVGSALGITLQIMFLKLTAAGCLLLAAFGSSRLAAKSGIVDPLLAFAAIAFNPLLIIEGPGGAHNDMMVIACMIMSLLFIQEKRNGLAGLFLGLAAGIKLFPLLLIPWIVAGMIKRGERLPVREALVFAGAAILPVVAGYGLFWRGLDTFSSLRQNFVNTQHTPVFTLALYASLSVWCVLRRDALPAAWAIFVTWLALYVPQIPYPWYLGWGLSIAVAGMDPRRMRLALVLGTIALMSELHAYAMFS